MSECESDICVNGYNFLLSEGNGSIGSVFKASKDKRPYAIKMINMNQIDNLNNFVLLMQKLQGTEKANPNVVRVFEFFQNPLNLFIAMEYCNQGNLLQYMCKQPNRRLDSYKAVDLFAQVLNGFKFLHANNIEHRNLKPQNILMHNGKPKITDYGIYMIYRGKEATYQMREFLSPENYEHQSDSISHLCDIWGLGVLFFFMLFGTWPFKDIEEIRKYTHNGNVFNLAVFIKDKSLELPAILQTTQQDFFTMISEIFSGLFVYESKNRMTFTQLCKHRIFLKIKNFNMEESFLFYLQAEKTLLNHSPTLLRTSFVQNLTGLPGVSARSMYSGDVEEVAERQTFLNQNLGQIRRSSSKKPSQVNNFPVETIDFAQDLTSAIDLNAQDKDLQPCQDLALGLDLGILFPKLRQQVPSFNQMILSANSDAGNHNNNFISKNIIINETPLTSTAVRKAENNNINNFLHPQSPNGILPDIEGYSFIAEGTHFSPMTLSTFSKMRLGHKKNQEGAAILVGGLAASPQKMCLMESESDFENIEEFDSFHKEVNNIPEFCILKACKMVDFQFKTNQDPYLKQIDSYCLSSVISIPRPSPTPNQETDNQKRSISTLYDLEIYRYRFIEETIRLVKNAYYDYLQPIIGYSQMILAEYAALKMSFYLSKTLLIKIEKNENFLRVDSADFIKFLSCSYHLKFVDVLKKDLERIFTQYYLSQTLVQNQDIKQSIDEQESKFFFFECSPGNLLQEIQCNFEDPPSNQKSPAEQFFSNAQSNKQTLQETPSFQDENPLSLDKNQQTIQASCQNERAKCESNSQNEKVKGRLVSSEIDRHFKTRQMHQEWEELKGELTYSISHNSITELDRKHAKDLDSQFSQYLSNIFNALKEKYKICPSAEEQLKILKLALRVAICCRYQDTFDKNQMESILIFFDKSENSYSSSNATSQNIISYNNILNQQNAAKGVSLGTSISSNFMPQRAKKQQSQQFSIETLLKWINSCSKQEIVRQIFLLVGQQL